MADVSEDIRNLAARYQEFQRQAEALRQEMGVVQASITSCDQTIVTINEPKARLPKLWFL
jgi:prefoldin alpha subunit